MAENENDINSLEGGEVLEPYVGMEFDSEDDARRYYNDYARKEGFVVRVMQLRRSETDDKTLDRCLGCNKQGFSPNAKGKTSARERCKASILFKMDKSGKWVVTRFIKDHNHPLVVSAQEQTNVGDKDKKIHKLARELQRQEELCAAYRERLIDLLTNVEKQAENLSSKLVAVVQNVREAETGVLNEALTLSQPPNRRLIQSPAAVVI